MSSEEITQRRLLHYLAPGRLHPTLLLVGPDREPKLRVAKVMAKFLLCEHRHGERPCDRCSPCRRIEKELHPDVLFVRDEDEDVLKIDRVRELCHEMEIGPIEAKAKICIIDECHRLNVASANAFLKTLEEPGAGRYFWLLTTQPGSLLPTILSRCLQFHFKPESERVIVTAAERERFRELFEEYLRTGAPAPLLAALGEKPQVQGFVRFLQLELHAATVAPATTSVAALRSLRDFELLPRFSEAVALEGRLRSNANYGLMLEVYLRKHFTASPS